MFEIKTEMANNDSAISGSFNKNIYFKVLSLIKRTQILITSSRLL